MRPSSPAARPAQHHADRLFRHDRLIVANALRVRLGRWHDRAIAIVMAIAAVAGLRAGVDGLSRIGAAWAACAAGAAIGFGVGRLVAARVAFHASDGLLAVDALDPHLRRRFVGTWLGVGLALYAAVLLMVSPALLLVGLAAFAAGALAARLAGGIGSWARFAAPARRGRISAWSHRPRTGLAAATLLLVVLLLSPPRMPGPDSRWAVVAIGMPLLGLILTRVDDAVIRFMTIVGHGPGAIIRRHIAGWAAFLGLAVPGCGLVLGPVGAGIALAAGVAISLFLILRILPHRLHAGRIAELVISLHVGVLVLAASALPLALPALFPAMLWHLYRRARTRTWLLT